jgi:hypothetical protein
MSLEEPSQDFSTPPSRANPPGKQPVSKRRIQANRRNALRSTGPKTARGKRAVAGNAIKHGFLAREVVITAGEGEESLKEFHDLVKNPVNITDPLALSRNRSYKRLPPVGGGKPVSFVPRMEKYAGGLTP